MLTFLIIGVLLVLALVIVAIIWMMGGRGKAVPTVGSRANDPAQARATGHGDN